MVEVQFYSALALQMIIATVMITRRLFPKARFFFAYIIWQTFAVAVMYATIHRYPGGRQFFYVYWTNNAINICLGLAIIVELFNRMFEQYPSVRRFAKIALLVSGAVLVVIGAAISTFHEAAYSVPILTACMVAERSLRIVQLGLIFALLIISRYLHLRWKNYLFGIAIGFGFYALMVLAGLTVRMYYGESVANLENTLQGTAYCAAVLIWSVYALQPDVVNVPIMALPSHELEKWDQALNQLLAR